MKTKKKAFAPVSLAELSHEANNLVMVIENDGDIYRALLYPLTIQVAKRIKKGQPVELGHLAECSTMKKVLSAGVRLVRAWGYTPTTADRKQAANFIASCTIETAGEFATL